MGQETLHRLASSSAGATSAASSSGEVAAAAFQQGWAMGYAAAENWAEL